MPKGTIRNTGIPAKDDVHVLSEMYPKLKRIGTIHNIDWTSDTDQNQPAEIPFISRKNVKVGDRVRFTPHRWGPIVLAYAFKKLKRKKK